jgi:hypothetical protein
VFHVQLTGSRVSDVLDLAAIRARDGPDGLGPSPSGLERRPLDPATRETYELDRRLVRRSRLVGFVEAPRLDTFQI